MFRPAISTSFPLPRQRTKGENDKSPQTNPTSSLDGRVPTSGEIIQIDAGEALTPFAQPEIHTMSMQPLKSFCRVLDELDAIDADTRPHLAPLTNAIRAFGNAQYGPLWMSMDFTQSECPVEPQAGAADAETFVAALKRKLATTHATGRIDCEYIDALTLSRALRTQVDKGDPVDVAILCMYLWMLGSSISSRDDCASSFPHANYQVETP